MFFSIGPYQYPLVISHIPGDLFGLCQNSPRRVLFSPTCPVEELLVTLLHELKHGWDVVLPCGAHDTEGKAEYFGAVVTLVHRELAKQGGEGALVEWHRVNAAKFLEAGGCGVLVALDALPELEPDPDASLDPWEYLPKPPPKGKRTGAADRRAGCAGCDGMFGAPCLVDCKQRFDGPCGGWVIDRALYCPVCRRLDHWVEGATPWGAPNGAVAYERVRADASEMRVWLDAHPAARDLDWDA